MDQTFLLWGLVTAGIFFTAQFFPISREFQAILWSTLTLIGTAGMAVLTLFWVELSSLVDSLLLGDFDDNWFGSDRLQYFCRLGRFVAAPLRFVVGVERDRLFLSRSRFAIAHFSPLRTNSSI